MDIPTTLYGQKAPKQVIQKEDIQDKMILFLIAQGSTDKEVAEKLDVSPAKVSMTRRQPWFTKELLEIVYEKGNQAVEKRLQAIQPELVELGLELAKNAKSEAVRVASIYSLLKVARGEKVIVEDSRQDLGEIRKEREELERQRAEIKGEKPRYEVPEPAGNN